MIQIPEAQPLATAIISILTRVRTNESMLVLADVTLATPITANHREIREAFEEAYRRTNPNSSMTLGHIDLFRALFKKLDAEAENKTKAADLSAGSGL